MPGDRLLGFKSEGHGLPPIPVPRKPPWLQELVERCGGLEPVLPQHQRMHRHRNRMGLQAMGSSCRCQPDGLYVRSILRQAACIEPANQDGKAYSRLNREGQEAGPVFTKPGQYTLSVYWRRPAAARP